MSGMETDIGRGISSAIRRHGPSGSGTTMKPSCRHDIVDRVLDVFMVKDIIQH